MFGSGKKASVVRRVDPQQMHQHAILDDFQAAVAVNDQAEQALRDAERIAAQAALALVEARKRMRRVTDGVV
jgi:predicted RNA-binding Zn ribbon-like protein